MSAMDIIPNKTGPARGSFFEKDKTKRPCWNCGYDSDDPIYCSHCEKIQHFLKESDYFTWFGLDYVLLINQEALEKQYYYLSRKFHPDYFQRTSQEEQAISLENSAKLNEAYRTLKNPKKRLAYLIALIEGANQLSPAPPADLFEEIFEIQERLEAVQEPAPTESNPQDKPYRALKTDFEKMQQYQGEADIQLKQLSSEWDAHEAKRKADAFSDAQRNVVDRMKNVLSHEAYLDRIIKDIKTALDKGK